MQVELFLKEEPFHLVAKNETGNEVHIDASFEIGGQNKGIKPMELLLVSLAGCTSIDVLLILQKQRQKVQNYRVVVNGERETGKEANLFRKIHIHYIFGGCLEQEKVSRAITLSLEKYCSVAKTLEKTAEISSSYEILPDC